MWWQVVQGIVYCYVMRGRIREHSLEHARDKGLGVGQNQYEASGFAIDRLVLPLIPSLHSAVSAKGNDVEALLLVVILEGS